MDKTFKNLLDEIKVEKFKQLDKNKDEILEKLSEEIVKRYYYDEGVFMQKVKFDPTIKKTISILNNSKQYNSILKI